MEADDSPTQYFERTGRDVRSAGRIAREPALDGFRSPKAAEALRRRSRRPARRIADRQPFQRNGKPLP